MASVRSSGEKRQRYRFSDSESIALHTTHQEGLWPSRDALPMSATGGQGAQGWTLGVTVSRKSPIPPISPHDSTPTYWTLWSPRLSKNRSRTNVQD